MFNFLKSKFDSYDFKPDFLKPRKRATFSWDPDSLLEVTKQDNECRVNMHKILNVCGVMLKELPPESEERMSIETRADIPTIFIHPYLPDNEYNIRVATCLAYILAEEELTNHDDAYQFALKLVIPKKALVRLLDKNSAFIAQNFGVTTLDVKARCVVLISDLAKVLADQRF